MIPWPQHLPKPQQAYSVGVDPRLVVTEFEVGKRQRRRYTHLEDTIKVVWVLTQFQLDVFRAFVKFELDNGANPFNTTIIGLDGIEDAEVILRNGTFSVSMAGPHHYNATADLVRVAPTTMDEDMLGILSMDELSDVDVFTFSCEALYIYVETTYGDFAGDELTEHFMELYS